MCRATVIAVIWIVIVRIPVKPIFGVRNGICCVTLTTFDWLTVDSSDSAKIL
jgi:hypothetical protein